MVASYCKFSQTGKEYNSSLGYALSSSPAAGIDIEYGPDARSITQDQCENGNFNHCEVLNNLGLALVNMDVDVITCFVQIDRKYVIF
ncbi:MAG: hypothetical protein IPH46_07935 [Bacteroidetes bacterium]|nr:hypothetical protein [Bacteroidota bacterium]